MERDLSDWTPCALPGEVVLEGHGVRLEPFAAARHGEALFATIGGPANDDLWRWLPVGPFADPAAMSAFLTERVESDEWRPLVILAADGSVLGSFSFMRLRPEDGAVELGAVVYGAGLRKSRAGTAAFHLSAAHVFDDLGYRRYEWKCNALNEASGRAARRYGFDFEGRFRQDRIVKGLSRDTDWYSIIDGDWPARRAALEAWLAPVNFDRAGQQRESLAAIRDRLAGA